MNESDLQQLLQSADAVAVQPGVRVGLANRVVHRWHRRTKRRRIATLTIVGLMIGMASIFFAHPVSRTSSPPVLVASRDYHREAAELDAAISQCNLVIAVLQRDQSLAALHAKVAAIRDPIAEENERHADELLAQAERHERTPIARRAILADVPRMFPSTIGALIARYEMATVGTEKRI